MVEVVGICGSCPGEVTRGILVKTGVGFGKIGPILGLEGV